MKIELGTVGLIFIVLKLTEVIDWSWWLVLLPFYAPIAVFLSILFAPTPCKDLSLYRSPFHRAIVLS